MSFVECNPNHCPSIKSMGESLVEQELKIKELEQQKAELIEFVEKEKAMAEGYFDYKPKDVILRCDHILKRCK